MIGWRHKKTGNLYRVIDHVVIENGVTPAVLYEAWDSPKTKWVRPCAEFYDGRFEMFEPTVDFPDDSMKPLDGVR